MPTLSLTIKHAGKTYPISANTDLPASAFKQAIYEATGVPPDRMKVMVKGGILKDDHDWSKTGLKDGGSVMVIGAAGPLPQAPEKATVFLEDMDDADLANALAIPVGLKNLGNTCYMNATVQALRGIPELQTALSAATSTGPASVPGTLRDLYSDMGRTTDAVIPLSFLQALRGFAPQFAEVDRSRAGKSLGTGSGPSAGLSGAAAMLGIGGGYAQQDAEECWTAIQSALKDVPGLKQAGEERSSANFIDQYMGVEIRRELKCDEAPEEEPSIALEKSLKIECNITKDTNFMASGISASLDQKVEKRSATLGRDAVYTQTSRVSRLPSYLTVHMVRFYWRQDISKKAKIMRKVKFPTSYDATDICTPELREQLLPVSRRLSELDRDRFERRKVRKRTKAAAAAAAATAGNVAAPSTATSSTTAPSGDVEMTSADGAEDAKDGAVTNAGEALEDEEVYRKKEREELEKLVSPALKRDTGCSPTGLYELVAIVTHKGAAADAGHYIGFVKKSVFHPGSDADDVGEDWYKFDDDKVSIFPAEKLATLDGGGEDASAYVLLYRTKELA